MKRQFDNRKREMKREMKEKELQEEGKTSIRTTKPGAISVVGPGPTKDIFAAEEMTETKIEDRKREMKEKEKNKRTKKEKGKPGVHTMKPGAFPVMGAGPTKDVFAAEEMSETKISDRKRETKEKEREKCGGRNNQKGKSGVRATKPGAVSVVESGPTKDLFAAEEMTETTINDRKREMKGKVINIREDDVIEKETNQRLEYASPEEFPPSILGLDERVKRKQKGMKKRLEYDTGRENFNNAHDETQKEARDANKNNTTNRHLRKKTKNKLRLAPPRDEHTGLNIKTPYQLRLAPPIDINHPHGYSNHYEGVREDDEGNYSKRPNSFHTVTRNRVTNGNELQPEYVAVGPGASQGGRIDDKINNLYESYTTERVEESKNELSNPNGEKEEEKNDVNHADVELASLNKTEKKRKALNQQRKIIAILLGLIIIGTTVGLGVGLSSKKTTSIDQTQLMSCNYTEITEIDDLPIAWKSCLCSNNRKANVPKSHLLEYMSLKERFIEKSILPIDFDNQTLQDESDPGVICLDNDPSVGIVVDNSRMGEFVDAARDATFVRHLRVADKRGELHA